VAGIGLLAIVWPLSYFHLVVDSKAHTLVMVGVLAEVLVVMLLPATEDRIAVAMLVTAGFTAFLLYQAGWAITRWSPPLSLLRPHEELLGEATETTSSEGIQLSIIVPCHNAGPGLRDFLARLEGELSFVGAYEVLMVSDGSTDDTLTIARELASPTLRVVHYPERMGKGHALRVGLSRARGRYVGFIDSDGDIDPQAIGPFLTLMTLYQPDVVLGSKRHPMSEVSYPPLRRVMSWVYHKLTRLLFRVNVRDTQTGLKVIRREVLVAVLPRMFEKRYAWDLELLVVARMLGFTKVFEAPVRIRYRFSSQVDPNAAFRIILDSVAIFYRRFILNSYRHTAHRLAVIRDDQALV
jgi:glycosyltransferase involved in cell wall biosynthesis